MGLIRLKYVTFRRIRNLFKLFLSYYLSKLKGKSLIWGMPITLSVEPTNYCNLKCPECPSGTGSLTRELGIMKFDAFKEIFDQIHKDIFYLQLFFQGEPFLNPELFRMISYAKEKKVFTSVSTNGHFIEKYIDQLMKSPPDKLILSVDGLDEESYQAYRKGGSLRKVEKGLLMLSGKKRESGLRLPLIELQFIVMRQNEHFLDDIHKYAYNLGADKVVLKTMHVSSMENGIKFLPENAEYSRYQVSGKLLNIKNKLNNGCLLLWKTAVVTWNGIMVPCCFDKDAKHKIDVLNGKTIRDIWFSKDYNRFRNKILDSRKSVDICTNCTEGMKINFR